MEQSENALDADKARVEQLTAAEAKASGAKKDALDDRLAQVKAQVELDQDEIDEARQDLSRAGGDVQGRLEALRQEHETSSKVADNTKVIVTPRVETPGLIHRYQQWSALHQKQLLLWEAKQAAELAAATFAIKHAELESQVGEQKANASAASPAFRPLHR